MGVSFIMHKINKNKNNFFTYNFIDNIESPSIYCGKKPNSLYTLHFTY